MLSFNAIRNGSRPKTGPHFTGTLAAFDPGETTGVVTFHATLDDAQLINRHQLRTWPLEECVKSVSLFLDAVKPDAVVFESYRVYGWKTDQHSFSEVPTIQVIGSIKTLLIQRGIPYFTQSAQQAKQFVTDEKLEAWGYWHSGLKHARDATRHACYFLLFGPPKSGK
jgi:hypothetical protein